MKQEKENITQQDKRTKPNYETIDETKRSVVFYENWYNGIKKLSKSEQVKAYRYILEYSFYGIEPDNIEEDKSPSALSFIFAKPNIESALERYKKSKENGSKGGRPKKITDEIIEKILKFRKNGLTQKQVASQLGLSIKSIQRIEKDKSQNLNVDVDADVDDNDDVNKDASLAPPTPLSYEEKQKVINLWSDHTTPGKIVIYTGFGWKQVNDTIDEYVKNDYKLDELEEEKQNEYDILLQDGTYYTGFTTSEFESENSIEAFSNEILESFIDPNGDFKFDKAFVEEWFETIRLKIK